MLRACVGWYGRGGPWLGGVGELLALKAKKGRGPAAMGSRPSGGRSGESASHWHQEMETALERLKVEP
jgi:hypothetical protein